MAAVLSLSSLSPLATQNAAVDMEAQLDDEILAIRKSIAELRAHKAQLSAALLGSSKIQKHVQRRKLKSTDGAIEVPNKLRSRLEKAVERQKNENDVKIHRLAYGVTAFPFTDPSPERAHEPSLTGVRFDLSMEGFGQSEKKGKTDSYFVILRRRQHQRIDTSAETVTTYLTVHHHTIPAHINLESLVDKHLPLPSELQDENAVDSNGVLGNGHRSRSHSVSFNDDSGIDVTQTIDPDGASNTPATNMSSSNTNTPAQPRIIGNGQNLHALVFAIRDDLQSWHNRVQSIAYVREAVGLPAQRATMARVDKQVAVTPNPEVASSSVLKYSILNIENTTADGSKVRIVWNNDALGLLKLSYEGTIDRAVVYGVKDGTGDNEVSHERLHDVERILTFDESGQKVKVQDLAERLRVCQEMVFGAKQP